MYEYDYMLAHEEILAIQQHEDSLRKLMQDIGNEVIQENGQRKIGGPPSNWVGPPPPKGCEIFVGRIHREVCEEELYRAFSIIGPIYELRLMMDFSGANRGFAFIQYTNSRDASNAIKKMNNFELRPNFRIGVLKSIDNCRLFVGGIPKDRSREEILAEMKKLTEGVTNVIVYSSIVDKSKNRGFAFVDYDSHRSASKARRKLIPDRVLLWGKEIAVDWAQPESEVEDEIMSKVTVLYVRNLAMTTTEQELKNIFNAYSDGQVTKLKMMRDFAFVHFSSRQDAEIAMFAANHTIINGSKIEVTWAKPVLDKQDEKLKVRRFSECSGPASTNFLQRKLSVPMMGLYSRPQFNESFTAFRPPSDHEPPMPSTSRIYERKISLPHIGLCHPNNSSLNESINSLNESLQSVRQPIRRQSMPILPIPGYLDWPMNNQMTPSAHFPLQPNYGYPLGSTGQSTPIRKHSSPFDCVLGASPDFFRQDFTGNSSLNLSVSDLMDREHFGDNSMDSGVGSGTEFNPVVGTPVRRVRKTADRSGMMSSNFGPPLHMSNMSRKRSTLSSLDDTLFEDYDSSMDNLSGEMSRMNCSSFNLEDDNDVFNSSSPYLPVSFSSLPSLP